MVADNAVDYELDVIAVYGLDAALWGDGLDKATSVRLLQMAEEAAASSGVRGYPRLRTRALPANMT